MQARQAKDKSGWELKLFERWRVWGQTRLRVQTPTDSNKLTLKLSESVQEMPSAWTPRGTGSVYKKPAQIQSNVQ